MRISGRRQIIFHKQKGKTDMITLEESRTQIDRIDRELTRLMKNLTNNVNQIARRLNEHGSIYETEIDEIRQRVKELWDILNLVLNRLSHAQ